MKNYVVVPIDADSPERSIEGETLGSLRSNGYSLVELVGIDGPRPRYFAIMEPPIEPPKKMQPAEPVPIASASKIEKSVALTLCVGAMLLFIATAVAVGMSLL